MFIQTNSTESTDTNSACQLPGGTNTLTISNRNYKPRLQKAIEYIRLIGSTYSSD